MNDGFSSSQGDRGGVPNVMILVSDGDANINIGDTSMYRGGEAGGRDGGDMLNNMIPCLTVTSHSNTLMEFDSFKFNVLVLSHFEAHFVSNYKKLSIAV